MKRVSLFLVPMFLLAFPAVEASAQSNSNPARVSGQLTEEGLGEVLNAIGLNPTKTEKRYDFSFKTSIRGEEWRYSMSAVLSRNEEAVWIMAWLDQIPETAAEVPRTALLKMLAANDRLGKGKFFAYIPSNKRFVLQRVVANENMSSRLMKETLQDLAVSVADEYPVWATAGWNPKNAQQVADDSDSGRPAPQNPDRVTRGNRIHASEAASRFDDRRVN